MTGTSSVVEGFLESTVPTRGKLRKRDYSRRRHDSRPWLVIDGEGVTVNNRHLYVEFAAMSKTDKLSHVITDADGLSGRRILEFLLKTNAAYPDHICVIYGGSYDFNMWLWGLNLSEHDLRRIYDGQFTTIGEYRIRWMKGKNFFIGRKGEKGGVTIYDAVSFFQTTFVNACDSYLGDRFVDRDRIVASKARRGDFTLAELSAITEYNNSELVNLIALMDELRERLSAAEMYPRRWDGPGAIAAYLMQREHIRDHMTDCPPQVQNAARHAYAGGRFEVLKFGYSTEPAYEYDVNSAYPWAMTDLPSLARGHWERQRHDPTQPIPKFALWQIRWDVPRADIPGPLFRRMKNGTVHFPMRGEGWYWSPEYEACLKYARQVGGTFDVLDIWAFVPADDTRPFGWIPEMYRKRQALKKIGNGAHVGYKLGLNSLYGKTCQQVGAQQREDGTWRLPPFHQLEWAGYITSACRARVLSAALLDIDSVIAFETDALFTSRPLRLKDSTDLGGWEATRFDNLTYMQSGTYYADVDGEARKGVAKTRGIDRGNLTREECHAVMREPRAEDRVAVATLRRFQGAGLALMQGLDTWCRWIEMEKRVQIEPTGKRIHSPNCTHPACKPGAGIAQPGWHATICPTMDAEPSHPFPVLWANPDSDMSELSEIRDSEVFWDDGLV